MYEDEVDLRRSGSYLNSSFQSAWSDHALEPDDIRVKPFPPLAPAGQYQYSDNMFNNYNTAIKNKLNYVKIT